MTRSTPRMKGKNKPTKIDLERPADNKQFVMKVIPFKARRDRTNLPFKKGQGITISGWQFQIRTINPNGSIILRPLGRIVKEATEKEAPTPMGPGTPKMGGK